MKPYLSPLLLASLLFASIASSACHAVDAPQSQVVLNLQPDSLTSSNGSEFGGSVLIDDSDASAPILRLVPPAEGKNETNARLSNHAPIQAGNHYRLQYAMRAVADQSKSSGQAGIEISIGALPPSGQKIERSMIELQSVSVVGSEWERFVYDWSPKRDYAPGELRIDLRPSYFRETIELKGVRMLDFKDTPPPSESGYGYRYEGQSPDADWRSEADARIREHRMTSLDIEVIDQYGQPLPEVEVKVEMLKHAYLFGTCVKAVRLMDAPFQSSSSDFDIDAYNRDTVIYREKLKELFNFVVFENDMKWPNWAGRAERLGQLSRTQATTLNAVNWLRDNHFQIKGHTMLWGSWQNIPEYLKDMADDPIALEQLIQNHLMDQGMAFAGKIEYMDVLNEAMSHNDMIETVGWDKISGWFKTAKKYLPQSKLVINEFDILGNGGSPSRQDDHAALIERLLSEGAPIDSLGFQSHFWSTRLTPPTRLYEIIDRFAGFDLPLMVSEFDMNILDEELQAEYSRDFLKTWFSHPATEAFIMWGFWGGAHWFGETGAMYRNDWSPKPNLKTYTDLVFGEWWTHESLKTGADGHAKLRAFKGDYEIIISAPGYHTAVRQISATDPTRLLVVLYSNQ